LGEEDGRRKTGVGRRKMGEGRWEREEVVGVSRLLGYQRKSSIVKLFIKKYVFPF
jgi:hypothetical protein